MVQVVAKVCRDMLKPSFSSLNEDAGNITETFKGMAMGSDEAPIDLEVALELAFKVWT